MIFNNQIIKKAMIALIMLVPILCMADYVPGVVLARLKRGVVELPQGQTEGTVESIKGNLYLKNYLSGAGMTKFLKVFCDFNPDDTIQQLENGEAVKVQDLSLVFKCTFDLGANIKTIIDSLKQYSDVIYAEPDYLGVPLYDVDDDSFSQQWALKQANDCDIDADLAWDIEKGNSNIRIGIVDNGLDYEHRDFGGEMGPGYKVKGGRRYDIDGDYYDTPLPWFDSDIHGTHVAGIASALTNNSIGIAGVSGGSGGTDIGCSMYGYCIMTEGGLTPVDIFALGLEAAADMTHVINASYGYEYSEVLREVCAYTYKLSRTLVASRGNYYEDNPDSLLYPSCYEQHLVISVGATDYYDFRAFISNIGQGLDVVAPGVDIVSTVPVTSQNGEKYARMSGTSMSAPLVTGLSALIRSRAYEKGVSLQPEDVEGIIRATAEDIPPAGYDDSTGAGRVNAYDALRYFDTPNSIRHYILSGVTNTYLGTFPLWLISIPGLPDDQYQVAIHEVYSSYFSLPNDTLKFLGIWGLGRLTTGYSFSGQQIPQYGEGWCSVEKFPGDQYRAKTYVYYVYNLDWQPIGWFPCSPENALLRYSIFSVNIVPPYNLRAEDITETSLTLRWNYAYPDLIDGFAVKRDGQVIGTPPKTQLYWYDTGLDTGRLYHYEVAARKGSIYSASAILDVNTQPSGLLAQSDYPKMSAFNSNRKVARGSDGKIHVIYYDGDDIYYSYSTDEGTTFASWENVCESDTVPALAVSNTGNPYIVYGVNVWASGTSYCIKYYIGRRTETGWEFSYHPVYQSSNTSSSTMPHPPSMAITSDSGYVVFRDAVNGTIRVSRFCLPLGVNSNSVQIASSGNNYPGIGYDKGRRLVILVHVGEYGPMTMYYRRLGVTSWSSLLIPNCTAYGAPTLWADSNEIRIAFEGDDAVDVGVIFTRFTWNSRAYVPQATELVSDSTDWSENGIIGYAYLASKDVLVWKYEDDIWYSRRTGMPWIEPVNISSSGYGSSYPQAIVFGSLVCNKLFTLWTEDLTNYYLVRKVIPLYVQPLGGGPQGYESALPFCFERMHPNPTKNFIRLQFYSPDERKVAVKIYDITGRLIKEICGINAQIGMNDLMVNKEKLVAGVYFVRLEAGDYERVERVIFIK